MFSYLSPYLLFTILAFLLVVQSYRHKWSLAGVENIGDSYGRLSHDDLYPNGDILYDLVRPLHNTIILCGKRYFKCKALTVDMFLRQGLLTALFSIIYAITHSLIQVLLVFAYMSFLFSDEYNIRNTKILFHGMFYLLFVLAVPVGFRPCLGIIILSTFNMECSCLFSVYYALVTHDYLGAVVMCGASYGLGLVVRKLIAGTWKVRMICQIYHNGWFRGLRWWRTSIIIGMVMLIPFLLGVNVNHLFITGVVFSVYAFIFPEACETKNWLVPYLSFILSPYILC